MRAILAAAGVTAAVLVILLMYVVPGPPGRGQPSTPTVPPPAGPPAPTRQHVAPAPRAPQWLASDRGPVRAVPASIAIPYAGTVDGPPESVYLSGLAQITSSVVRDPDFGGPPTVRLLVDLSNVSGVGLSTGAKYVASGGQRLIRPLVATDVVEITFPVVPSNPGGALEARSAVATFTLDYNTRTGSLTGGTASTIVNLVGLSRYRRKE